MTHILLDGDYFMWYLKDYQGNVSGPYEFNELSEVLREPLHQANASLVRHGDLGSWKPAMLAFPDSQPGDLKTIAKTQEDEPASNPDVPLNASDEGPRPSSEGSKPSCQLEGIATAFSRMRFVIAAAFSSAFILLFTVLNHARVQQLEGELSSIIHANSIIASVTFMLYPLSILIRVIRTKKASTTSIQNTVSLHHRFWSSIFITATLSMALIVVVLLLK